MRSPRRLSCLVLVLFCAVSALAQSNPYKPGSPLLMWKVSSRTNSAYVLGSVHLGDKSLYPLPAVIENAFNAASVLIVEVDIRKVDPSETVQLMASGAYPPGDDLFKHITPETRARVTTFLGGYGMPPELFSRMRPWMLGVMLQMLPMMKDGLNPNEGIDSYFLNKAGDKRVDQVEDAEWQIKLLSGMPDSLSDKWLSSAVTQAAESKELWAKFETYWTQGAADKLAALNNSTTMKDTADERAFERRLNADRNPRMADRLEKCLQATDACFMVVGAAHVVGSEGIIKLLQSRGYRVEQATVEKAAVENGGPR